MDWDTVTAADAAEPKTRAAAGLTSLVNRTIPAVHQAIAAPGREVPLLITEVAPLARYGHLASLSRWTDLAAPRPTAIWLLVPQLHGTTGGLVDGQPLPWVHPDSNDPAGEPVLACLRPIVPSHFTRFTPPV